MNAPIPEPSPSAVPASDLPAIAAFSVHRGVPGDLAVLAWQAAAESERQHFRAMADAAVSAASLGMAFGQTPIRLHSGEAWPVRPDMRPGNSDGDEDPDLKFFTKFQQDAHTRQQVPLATLRRVGWLDQKGRVWGAVPPMVTFDGGSLTPLLIDTREDGR